MTFRVRTRGPSLLSGTRTIGTVVSNATQNSLTERIEDTVTGQPYTDHALLIRKTLVPAILADGDNRLIGAAKRACSHYPTAGSYYFPGHSPLGAFSASSIATQAAARTNPSRPHVSLPVFLFEIKDIPRMVYELGASLAHARRGGYKHFSLKNGKGISSDYLAWRFGWSPYISDLHKLLNFQETTERRFRELTKLREEGGLSKRCSFTSESVSAAPVSFPFETLVFGGTGRRENTTTREVWAVVKWKPNPVLQRQSEANARAAMRTALLGLNSSQIASNVWEAMPWSWLIDWFTDIGDYLKATDNSIAYISQPINVMRHTKTNSVQRPVSYPGWVKASNGYGYLEEKERFLSSPTPISATLPILNGGQLSILTALAVTRL